MWHDIGPEVKSFLEFILKKACIPNIEIEFDETRTKTHKLCILIDVKREFWVWGLDFDMMTRKSLRKSCRRSCHNFSYITKGKLAPSINLEYFFLY